MVLAVLAAVLIGQARKPADTGEPSTAIVGTYTYVYDNAGVLTDEIMSHIDAMNVSLFAQTGAQILVETVDTTGDKTMEEYAIDLGNAYHVGDAERNNGLVILLALDNIAQNGLVGDYWVVGGDGLASYGNELTSLLVANMEADFAAGDYGAAVEKTFDRTSTGSPPFITSPSGKITSPRCGKPIPTAAATTPSLMATLHPRWIC